MDDVCAFLFIKLDICNYRDNVNSVWQLLQVTFKHFVFWLSVNTFPPYDLIGDDGRILGSEHWAAGIAKPDGWGNLQYKHNTCMLCVDRCVQTAYLSVPKKTCIPTGCQRSYG